MFRPIRKRVKHQGVEEHHLDLTAMIDVVTILIFFLLIHYDASNNAFSIAKNIVLPDSVTKESTALNLSVQVSPEALWVGNTLVTSGHLQDADPKFFDTDRNVFPQLYDQLLLERQKEESKHLATPGYSFNGQINLMVDRSVGFGILRKVLATCASAGFKQYKFIVTNNSI
jgi:biopolymer transport protein ExbD